MMPAIFIFLILILLMSVNVHFFIKSMDDTVKLYIRIGRFYMEIPHHKLLAKLKKKDNLKKIKPRRTRIFTKNIISHSVLDHFYISKSSTRELSDKYISNAFYYIFTAQIKSLFIQRFRLVDLNQIRLVYDPLYENIDYYFDAHISVINFIWASIKSIIKR